MFTVMKASSANVSYQTTIRKDTDMSDNTDGYSPDDPNKAGNHLTNGGNKSTHLPTCGNTLSQPVTKQGGDITKDDGKTPHLRGQTAQLWGDLSQTDGFFCDELIAPDRPTFTPDNGYSRHIDEPNTCVTIRHNGQIVSIAETVGTADYETMTAGVVRMCHTMVAAIFCKETVEDVIVEMAMMIDKEE